MENLTEADELSTIVSAQREEIMVAKSQVSDHDFAFNLQLQEAMAASLALQPSSSRSPPPRVADSAFLTLNDDVFDYTSLLLEDIERLEQERRDREQCEAEFRKTREDLDRRIHDQKLASEIVNIPEDEWQKYGDNFHRPYENAASSSSSSKMEYSGDLVEKECFRLYFKGLVSEEMVRGMKVMVGAIGVAICDKRDNPIFEMKKPLEVATDGAVSGEVAELEALIEGLSAALSLDLKRINFLTDEFMICQYVTGRVSPRQSKIATLVGEVALLQRKFTHCSPSHVARNNVKFAFKLARVAIVGQITWCAETSNGKSFKETCTICFEDSDVDQMFSVDGCLHRYCFSCMKQHVEVKLLHGMAAKCPHQGCESEVNIDSCGKFLAPKLVEIMSQRIKEASIPVTEKIYCPYPTCSALMSKSEALEYTNKSFVGALQSGARKCMKCHFFFCINCEVPWHYNMTCNIYKGSNPNLRAGDAMLNSLATKKRWRQCVKCNHMVELAEGCYHITCRCGYEFCYTCGAQWKNKRATCHCPIWDEANIIRR